MARAFGSENMGKSTTLSDCRPVVQEAKPEGRRCLTTLPPGTVTVSKIVEFYDA